MSYYEKRIKVLEEKVAEMARMQRHKAIPVEAKLVERIAEYQAENTRLKAEVERLRASSFVTAVPVEQYERLIKAGDAVCESPYLWETDPAVIAWRAAKEGKQP
jgi:hypothetical protein